MPKTISGVLVLLLLLVAPACERGGADFVFRGGGVYTMDGDRPWAESVVVEGGRIVAVGSDAETAAAIGRGTEVIDLTGKMLLPGFQDSHTHPILGATLEPLCRLDEATSQEAVLEAVAGCARGESSDDWLLAFGWRSSLFFPEIAPRKEALDAVAASAVGDSEAIGGKRATQHRQGGVELVFREILGDATADEVVS